jgi:hypothetical protein
VTGKRRHIQNSRAENDQYEDPDAD